MAKNHQGWTIIQPPSTSTSNKTTSDNSKLTCDVCKDWNPKGNNAKNPSKSLSFWNKSINEMDEDQVDQFYGHFYEVHKLCKQCDISFSTRTLAIDHFETKHGQKGRCKYCKYYSFHKEDLVTHLFKMHQSKPKKKCLKTYKQADQIFHCNLCELKIKGHFFSDKKWFHSYSKWHKIHFEFCQP